MLKLGTDDPVCEGALVTVNEVKDIDKNCEECSPDIKTFQKLSIEELIMSDVEVS